VRLLGTPIELTEETGQLKSCQKELHCLMNWKQFQMERVSEGAW
jgi:hypothetical protein